MAVAVLLERMVRPMAALVALVSPAHSMTTPLATTVVVVVVAFKALVVLELVVLAVGVLVRQVLRLELLAQRILAVALADQATRQTVLLVVVELLLFARSLAVARLVSQRVAVRRRRTRVTARMA